jgi:hypothetical protein
MITNGSPRNEAERVQCPKATEFLSTFVEAFLECSAHGHECLRRGQKRTAFMIGKEKESFSSGNMPVLRRAAKKLQLRHEYEYLRLDLVLFPAAGKEWGNFVVVEHENEANGFDNEIEKLMSVLAPLKVGITYGTHQRESELLELIQRDFATRHPSVLESPNTEYLFLLGVEQPASMAWRYLTFTSADGPAGKVFKDCREL